MKRRILSILMVLSMCLSMLPTAAFAAEVDTGLCEHHPEHTEECGYAEAVTGADCTHEHTAECYTNGVLPAEADCTHTHDEDCYVTNCVHVEHDGECGYTEAVPCGHEHDAVCGYAAPVEETPCGHTEHTDCGYAEAAPCTHAHDTACGYDEAVGASSCTHTHDALCGYAEAADCTHTHDTVCGYVAPVEEQPCNHTTHDDSCGYVEGAPCTHVCTEDTGCVTLSCAHVHDETCSSAGELACQHVHDETCGYVEAVEASPCTYECALCGLTEITAWSWIDDWEMIDPDTGVLALPGASADNPALFDVIVSMLPVEINATVDGNVETVALGGWACPGYPEEGAYSGNYIFTATLPEGYTLAEDAPELAVTVELGGAAVYAEDTTTHANGLIISGGVLDTDFSFTDEVLCYNGKTSFGNAANSTQGGIKILSSTPLILSGTMTQNGNYTGIYIPADVTANLTLDNASIGGGNHTAPITVEGTLYLTLIGSNVVDPHELNDGTTVTSTAGIWVLENGSLEITEQSTGSLTITASYGNPAIGQTGYATSDNFGTNYKNNEGTNKAGSITINGGILTLTSEGSTPDQPRSYNSGAAIGSAWGGDFTSITINGGNITAVSYTGAAIGAGWKDTAFSAPTGSVTINGGTINATGGQSYTSDGVGGSTDAIDGGVTITGGSVKNAANYNRPTDGTNGLYLATITLYGVTSATAITEVKYYVGTTETTYGTGNDYAYTDMQTDTSGNLYLWLPEGAVVSSVTADGSSYTGNLLVQNDDSAEGTFYAGNTYTVTLAENSNVTDSLPYGSKFAAGATVYVQVVANTGYAVTGVDTTENPSSYTWVDGNIYSFTMPSNAVTVYATAQQVNLPDTLDLSLGDITFGYSDALECRYLTYYAASGGELQTVNYIPAGQTYTITQSNNTTTTENVIKIENWDSFTGDKLPLKLTISNLNINADTGETGSESLSENLIDIDKSTVELTLDGTSTLTSNVPSYTLSSAANNRMKALLSVDSTSELTITQASGSNSLIATAKAGYGSVIGGDGTKDSEDGVSCGIINIKGGKILATIGGDSAGQGAAIGGGRYGTGGTVNISGGEVAATSYGTGAAIGSGAMGTGFTVNISGGTVTAKNTYTSQSGAAIGSGYNGGANVTISGGDIDTMVSNSYAPAIGSGYGTGDGANATVSIIGGNINIDNVTEATIGKGSNSKATVTITGGSVNGTKYNGASITDGTNEVYLITADLSDTVGGSKAVTGSITGGTYKFDGVKTNSEGKIFLWLPDESEANGTTSATFGGESYTGTVETDNSGAFAIAKTAPTVTAPTANSRTYDGAAQALVTAGSTSGGTLQYALGTDDTTAPTDGWGTTPPTGTDADTYYVWYKVVGNNEYADVAATCVPVTIAKRAITVKADDQTVLQNNQPSSSKISVTSGTLVDGHTLTATLKTVTDVATLGTQRGALEIDSVTIMSGSTDVSNNYDVTPATGDLTVANHTHSWSYELTTTNTTNDTIKATCSNGFGTCTAENNTATITLNKPARTTYGGVESAAATTTVKPDGALTAPTEITYSGRNGTSYGPNTTAPTNAGDYTASITVGGVTAQVEYTITAKILPDATLSATSGNYTGSAHTLTVTVAGLTEDSDYTVTFPTDMTNGGAKTITVKGMGNYTGEQELTYTIAPIAPTAANFSFTAPTDLTYSGTAKAATVAPATDINGMGTVTVKYSADPVNVGDYTVSIDVAAGTNYKAATGLTSDAWKFSITKAPLTVKADDKTMTTGYALPTFTYTITGFVNDETESVLTTKPVAQTSTDGGTAGTFDITVSGAVAANYEFTYVNGTLSVVDHQHDWTYTAKDGTITAKCGNAATCPDAEQSITISAEGKTYDGAPVTATLTGSIDGVDDPTISYSGNTNVGTYTASIKLDNAEAKVSFEIKAAMPVITWTSGSQTVNYTGEKATITAPTVTLVNSETFGGTISYSYAGTSIGIGLPINAGTYEITASVVAQGNYTAATSTNKLTLTINKIASSCTAPAAVSGLAFNGGNQNLVTAGTATGGTMQYSLDNSNWSATIPTGKDAGSYTVYYKVVGDSNHNDNAGSSVSVAIAPKTVTAPTIEGIEAQYLHTGAAITPVPTAVKDGNTVIDPSEYTVAYENNTDEGTATVKIVDAANGNYTVSGSTTFKIVVHEHDWKYSASGDTITAVCEGTTGTCPVANKTVTIALTAPAGDALTYKDGEEKTVTVTQTPADIFALPNVVYSGDRTNVGSVTASLTYGGVTASVSFTITKASRSISAPALSGEAGVDTVTLTVATPSDGDGTIQYGWAAANDVSTVTNWQTGTTFTGLTKNTTYYFFARVTDGTNYVDATSAGAAITTAKPKYTVTFDVGVGTTSVASQTITEGETATKPNAYTTSTEITSGSTKYRFLGWYTSDGAAYDFSTALTADLTLTAKWVERHTVNVVVTGQPNVTYNDFSAQLVAVGGTATAIENSQITKETSNGADTFSFEVTVDAGQYNLVVTAIDANNQKKVTATSLEDLRTTDREDAVTLPESTKNSVVAGSDTTGVIAGGVNEIAADKPLPTGAESITISLTVANVSENDVPEDTKGKIEEVAQGQTIGKYLDIGLWYQVDAGDKENIGNDNDHILKLLVPYDTSKKDVTAYRVHDGRAEAMGRGSANAKDGEYYEYEAGDGFVTIYAKKFSDYALGHTDDTQYTITLNAGGGTLSGGASAVTGADGKLAALPAKPTRSGYTFNGWYTAANGGTEVDTSTVFSEDTTIYAQWTQNSTPSTGGGGGVSTYIITLEDADNGTVKSDRTRASYGSTVTITVAPDEGYKLGSLTVTDANGKEIEVTDKGDGKYTFKMPSGKVTVEASFVSDTDNIPCDGGADCPSAKFIDIDPNAWYHEALDHAIENGLMGGYGNGYFGPNDNLSRAQLAQILYNLEGKPSMSGASPFTDVAEDLWYTSAIKWAQANGIVGGYGDGRFGPDDPITREQLAAMLWRYAGSPVATKKELEFTDADKAGDWAVDALIWAQENGVMVGNNNAVDPKGNATRAHVAQMLKNFIENILK